MADDSSAERSFEQVTRNHDEVKRWLRQRGGRPASVAGEDVDELAVLWPDSSDEALVEIGWAEFFDRFEARELAFAYRDTEGAGAECALVDRDRAEEIQGEGSGDAERSGTAPDDDPPTGSAHEAREREARDDANPDLHRDEPPFNS